MARETLEIKKPKLLVVEGREEQMFFEALNQHLGLKKIQIMPIGGKEKLRGNLKALVRSPGFPQVVSLAVVRDADEDPDGAFQSVRDALQAAGLPTPEKAFEPVNENPRVAVLILPKADRSGMLEDLCLEAVVQDPAMECVERYFQCLQEKDLTLPHNISKAKVQVFLASRPKAGLRLGEAAQAGYWPWDAEAFHQVKNFLSSFFCGQEPAKPLRQDWAGALREYRDQYTAVDLQKKALEWRGD